MSGLELSLALFLSKRLGPPQIAYTRGWMLATDDGQARKFAKTQGIRLTGSLGILIKAAEQGVVSLTEANALHARMIDQGYRSPLLYENGISDHLNRQNQ